MDPAKSADPTDVVASYVSELPVSEKVTAQRTVLETFGAEDAQYWAPVIAGAARVGGQILAGAAADKAVDKLSGSNDQNSYGLGSAIGKIATKVGPKLAKAANSPAGREAIGAAAGAATNKAIDKVGSKLGLGVS